MTTATIIAFLAFLSAFNVPAPTIQNVSNILYTTQASTSQVTAVTTLQATPTGDTTLTVQNSPQTPTFGATITPMDKSAMTVEQTGTVFKVRVLDAEGKYVNSALVNMSAADIPTNLSNDITNRNYNRKTVDETGAWGTQPNQITKGDWFASFEYAPVKTGNVVFTSGSLSKSITIEVQ